MGVEVGHTRSFVDGIEVCVHCGSMQQKMRRVEKNKVLEPTALQALQLHQHLLLTMLVMQPLLAHLFFFNKLLPGFLCFDDCSAVHCFNAGGVVCSALLLLHLPSERVEAFLYVCPCPPRNWLHQN